MALVIDAFFANVIEAFVAPRRSARRILDMAPTVATSLLMFVLGFAMQSVLEIAAYLVFPWADEGGATSGVGGHLRAGVVQLIVYGVEVGAAFTIGRSFGGKAEREEIAAVVAWHYVVTSLFTPIYVISLAAAAQSARTGEGGGVFAAVASMGVVAIWLWLFASFIAEAHGFRRVGPVVAASFGAFLVLGFILVSLLSAFGLTGPAG